VRSPEARKARNARSIGQLGVMAAIAALYLGLLATLHRLSGISMLDGITGVVLGLFICSFPVRHFLDLLIYWKTEGHRFPTRRATGWWIAGNFAVLALGWLVIVTGATRFMHPGP
jgi:hypothetical protein